MVENHGKHHMMELLLQGAPGHRHFNVQTMIGRYIKLLAACLACCHPTQQHARLRCCPEQQTQLAFLGKSLVSFCVSCDLECCDTQLPKHFQICTNPFSRYLCTQNFALFSPPATVGEPNITISSTLTDCTSYMFISTLSQVVSSKLLCLQ